MAEHISIDEANAWLEPTKLTLSALDDNLETQVTTQVYARLLNTFDTSTWVNSSSTPKIVRSIIAMLYVSWVYDKTYSDDAEANAYAALLRQYADMNLQALVSGALEIEEYPTADDANTVPTFFPNDDSSSRCATLEFPSDGPPAFTMGTTF